MKQSDIHEFRLRVDKAIASLIPGERSRIENMRDILVQNGALDHDEISQTELRHLLTAIGIDLQERSGREIDRPMNNGDVNIFMKIAYDIENKGRPAQQPVSREAREIFLTDLEQGLNRPGWYNNRNAVERTLRALSHERRKIHELDVRMALAEGFSTISQEKAHDDVSNIIDLFFLNVPAESPFVTHKKLVSSIRTALQTVNSNDLSKKIAAVLSDIGDNVRIDYHRQGESPLHKGVLKTIFRCVRDDITYEGMTHTRLKPVLSSMPDQLPARSYRQIIDLLVYIGRTMRQEQDILRRYAMKD